MAVAVAGVTNATGAGSTIAVTAPTGTADGVAMLAIYRPGFGGVGAAPSGGATWNALATITINANQKAYLYGKVAASEPASQNWTNTNGVSSAITVIALTGAHATNPFNVVSAVNLTGADNFSIDAPSLTTLTDNSFIVYVATEAGGGVPSASWPAGVTERSDHGAVRLTVATDDTLKTPAGATATRRCTWSSFVGTAQGAVTLAIAPAATATTHSRSATLSGTASIATAASFWTIFASVSAITATSSIATVGRRVLARSAAITATGSVSTVGRRTLVRSSALAAAGSIATVGRRTLQRSSALSATGVITSAGTFWSALERSSALSATAAISTAARRDVLRASLLSATAAITTAGQVVGGAVTHSRSASLTASASVASTASFWSTLERSAALTATSTVTTDHERTLQRTAALTATGAVTVAGQIVSSAPVHERVAGLAASGSLTASAVRVVHRAAAVTTVASIASIGQRGLLRSALLSVSGVITTGRQVDRHRSVVLAAAASVTASGVGLGPIQSVGVLEGGSGSSGREASSGVSGNESSSGVIALIE